jgi:hypothetical protein
MVDEPKARQWIAKIDQIAGNRDVAVPVLKPAVTASSDEAVKKRQIVAQVAALTTVLVALIVAVAAYFLVRPTTFTNQNLTLQYRPGWVEIDLSSPTESEDVGCPHGYTRKTCLFFADYTSQPPFWERDIQVYSNLSIEINRIHHFLIESGDYHDDLLYRLDWMGWDILNPFQPQIAGQETMGYHFSYEGEDFENDIDYGYVIGIQRPEAVYEIWVLSGEQEVLNRETDNLRFIFESIRFDG